MRFTDIFIRRPVLAISISLLIALLGCQAVFKLSVRQYPDMTNTVLTVRTLYSGASAELVQGFITQPLEQAIAEADNIDYISAQSKQGMSVIKVNMKLNSDPNAALANIMAKINSVRSQLPKEIEDPDIKVSTGDDTGVLYIAFNSDNLNPSQMDDYIERVIKPELFTVNGISEIDIYGGTPFGLRVWLDPQKMAAFGLSTNDVTQALQSNNYQSAVGQINNDFTVYNGVANTQSSNPESLKQLVLKTDKGRIVRLGDIAKVTLSKDSDNYRASYNGKKAVFAVIKQTPSANPIDVAADVNRLIPDIQRNLPSDIKMTVAYDTTVAINDSIHEVILTIIEAAVIVLFVITLFIGSIRSVIIPIITIPLSLIGVALVMQLFGFSWNLLTLLAMVLAIGLVVDDAIVVLENIERHLKSGESPFRAAIIGTRQIAMPVISMTITLAAVYSPIAFMGGVTGSLFKEFALTLAGAVFISGIIALTLSPVMCSKILKDETSPNKFQLKVERTINVITTKYVQMLSSLMKIRSVVVVFALCTFVSLPILFKYIPSEMAPKEDNSNFVFIGNSPSSANLDYIDKSMNQMNSILFSQKSMKGSMIFSGIPESNQGFGIAILKPYNERSLSQHAVFDQVSKKIRDIPQMSIAAFEPPSLPGNGGGLPIQFIIKTPNEYKSLFHVAGKMLTKVAKNPMFVYSHLDLKFDAAELNVDINKDKAGALGVTMKSIGDTLSTMLSGAYIDRVDIMGRSYKVVPELERKNRFNPSDLNEYYVKSKSGKIIPLGSLVKVSIKATAPTLPSFDQQNSATIGLVLAPGASMGDAVNWLNSTAEKVLPKGYSHDYAGASRQYVTEGNALYGTFVLALAIIFLVLAIQFESIRDPLVILVSVPLAISGALIALAWGASSMNIYSQVGLITLVGLISKHGILICEVAKEEQLYHGKNRLEAVIEAAKLRLRPILMTTCAMIAGLIPLLFASGSGAASRFSIGVVIVAGLAIGTLFTLFVLPVIYTFLASEHKPLPVFVEDVDATDSHF